ncbi:MAG: nucleotidyl transferase AbiEii/AbiGii toxin family protein [Acidobacteriota bacterium]
MSPSRELLERCSDETGYAISPLEKVTRLGEFASNIGRHPLLGRVLALKGGTALNLCFGPPTRLSVDLDYNYLGQLERGKMIKERPNVEEALAGLAARMQYQIQWSADAFAGRKLYLQYRSALGVPDRIEVDVNYLFRLPLAGTVTKELWQPSDMDRPTVTLVSLEEIIVGKLLAFFDRCAPRDLWDLANLHESAQSVAGSASFRARFLAMSAILDHAVNTYGPDRIGRMVTERAMAEQLVPMLIAGEAPNRPALIEAAWGFAARFVTLAANEEAYLAAIGRGELALEHLFPSAPPEAARLAHHPALLWKITNVREHLKRSV